MINKFENNLNKKPSVQAKKGGSKKNMNMDFGFEDVNNMGMGNNDGFDQNYIGEPKKKKQEPEKKDPMVWDPPERSKFIN